MATASKRFRRRSVSAGDNLEARIVARVLPDLARGLLSDLSRRQRTASRADEPTLAAVLASARGLLQHLLVLFIAEQRGLLGRHVCALVHEIAGAARPANSHRERSTKLHQRLLAAIDAAASAYPDAFELRASTQLLGVEARVPDPFLASAIHELARDDAIEIRRLGTIHERLLGAQLVCGAEGNVHLHFERATRKAWGAYYTPSHIIDYLVRHTLAPVVRRHLQALRPDFAREGNNRRGLMDRLFGISVLDPAMGSGHFMIAAVDWLTEQLENFLDEFPGNGVAKHLKERQGLRREVLRRCIYGVDLDATAVEIARQCLWLHCSTPALRAAWPAAQLRVGNTLLDPVLATRHSHSPLFDAILGNPPYGAAMTADELTQARQTLPLLKSNSDTAVGFLEYALRHITPRGRVGFIVPKPLTYSHAWRAVRGMLRENIETLADVSRAWRDVRLEQVIVVAKGQPVVNDDYIVTTMEGKRFAPSRRMPRWWARRFDTLPCALDAGEVKLLATMRASEQTVGDLCRTFRGLPAQRILAERGAVPVIGGRDLARWHVRSCSGYLPAAPKQPELAAFRAPKLVFQNIIAHISRPAPHIRLIGTYDDEGRVTLDTVNNIIARGPDVDLWGMLALLHSTFVNWFVYAVVYNKAIRTMHFDQYFLNKIVLPPDAGKVLARLGPLGKGATELQDGRGDPVAAKARVMEKKIDEIVCSAYRVRCGNTGLSDRNAATRR